MVITKICVDCGTIKQDTTRRITSKDGLYRCKSCSDKHRRHPRKHCSECGKELYRSYDCHNSVGRDLCIKCASKYITHLKRVPVHLCVDCNKELSRTSRIRNRWNVYLCKSCSDKRRTYLRKHCNDCGKQLGRSYKIQNKYGFPLCNRCATRRQFEECHPATKKPWNKKQPIKCSECNIELPISYKIHNRFGIPLCKQCNHNEKYQYSGKPCKEENKKKTSIRNSHPMDKKTKEKISSSLKGHVPWNKGLTKQTNEIICTLSFNKKGKPSPKKGRPQPQTAGDKNPSWKGGTSFLPYCYKYNDYTKEAARNKYNRTCLNCSKPETENLNKNGSVRLLSTHHIYYNKTSGCDGSNIELVPLCNRCHGRTQSKRDYWQEHLKALINLWNIRDVWNWWDII